MNTISKVHIMCTGEFLYGNEREKKGHYFPIQWDKRYSLFKDVWWSLYIDSDPVIETNYLILHLI